MRRLSILVAFLIAAFALTLSAAALQVPDNEVSENRNGQQLIIRTYTLLPNVDPETLIEDPFIRDGYDYSFVSIVKEEHPFETKKTQRETVTIETETDNISDILGVLEAIIPYDDGKFSGTLALDHTTLQTEASGYSNKSYTVTETKTYSGLDRNDPSYIPATTVKNGVTLTLQNIEWSVQSTAISGDALVATTYMATASYSASASRKVADGYITTAIYAGEVVSSGIVSITYTVSYLGELVPEPEPEPESESEPEPEPESELTPESESELEPGFEKKPIFKYILFTGLGLLVIAAALTVYLLTRKNTIIYAYSSGDGDGEYELIGKLRLSVNEPIIDLRLFRTYPLKTAIISINRCTATRLFGRMVSIRLRNGTATHTVEQVGKADYMFTVSTSEEE